VVVSPHRRTIQTAVLGFAGILAHEGVKLHLLPAAQGVSARLSNIGFPREQLEVEIPKVFEGNELASKAATSIIYDDVVNGWNTKVCCLPTPSASRFKADNFVNSSRMGPHRTGSRSSSCQASSLAL
jgi:hypothetical protein